MVHIGKTSNIFQAILELQKNNEKAALVTVTGTKGSTPRETGSRMIVRADGSIIDTIGGGAVEKLVIARALKVIRSGSALRAEYDLDKGNRKGKRTGMICGGSMQFFIENIQVHPSLYIFGAGHCGQALYQLGLMNRFSVFMADDRKEVASRKRYPEASGIFTGPYGRTVPKIGFKEHSYAVIMTEAHRYDELVLRKCLEVPGFPFRYLAMVSSRKKADEIKGRCIRDGYPVKKIKALHAPAGLEIGSKAPAEIAVSIMAEMIKVKNGL
ncbi:MAG: XdhC family protein [bacterium]|nr:XdhC family protein [bacterium]